MQLVTLSGFIYFINVIATTPPTITATGFLSVILIIVLIREYSGRARGSLKCHFFFPKEEGLEEVDLNKIESYACPCILFNNPLTYDLYETKLLTLY